MAREDFDLSLTRYADEGWRATFYTTGREHSARSAIEFGGERRRSVSTRRSRPSVP